MNGSAFRLKSRESTNRDFGRDGLVESVTDEAINVNPGNNERCRDPMVGSRGLVGWLWPGWDNCCLWFALNDGSKHGAVS